MKNNSLIFTLLSLLSITIFTSCDENEKDLNKIDTTVIQEEITKTPEEKVDVTNDSCSSFEENIKTPTTEEIEKQLLKDNSSLSAEVLTEINAYRKSLQLPEFSSNTTAKYIASIHNDYQISEEKISHDNFKFRSCSLFNILDAKATGENVASGYKTAKEVLEGWLQSEGHKKNIEGDFTTVGIAVTANNEGVLFYSNLFYK